PFPVFGLLPLGTSRESNRENHKRRLEAREPRVGQVPPPGPQRPGHGQVRRRVLCATGAQARRPLEQRRHGRPGPAGRLEDQAGHGAHGRHALRGRAALHAPPAPPAPRRRAGLTDGLGPRRVDLEFPRRLARARQRRRLRYPRRGHRRRRAQLRPVQGRQLAARARDGHPLRHRGHRQRHPEPRQPEGGVVRGDPGPGLASPRAVPPPRDEAWRLHGVVRRALARHLAREQRRLRHPLGARAAGRGLPEERHCRCHETRSRGRVELRPKVLGLVRGAMETICLIGRETRIDRRGSGRRPRMFSWQGVFPSQAFDHSELFRLLKGGEVTTVRPSEQCSSPS
ncbi:hypothetical protein CTA2_13036, partial [Colletotrichum tanaceti]